jgi:hypothetical protein
VLLATAVPLSANGHAAAEAVPVVVQFIVAPFIVPLAVPVTGTPAHVAVYAIVAVVAPVGVINQFIAVQAPAPVVAVVDRHEPVNALIAVVVVVGADEERSHAASMATSIIAIGNVSGRICTSH